MCLHPLFFICWLNCCTIFKELQVNTMTGTAVEVSVRKLVKQILHLVFRSPMSVIQSQFDQRPKTYKLIKYWVLRKSKYCTLQTIYINYYVSIYKLRLLIIAVTTYFIEHTYTFNSNRFMYTFNRVCTHALGAFELIFMTHYAVTETLFIKGAI